MSTKTRNLDVLIVGAGVAGLYALHSAREAGLRVRLFEGAPDLGGTWYWNRYPGCRCDIESVEYSYSFNDALQQEWSWSERYAAQPEILRYLNWVAERLALRPDMEFDTWVRAARWSEDDQNWVVELHTNEVVTTRFLVTATGCLSAPKAIDIPGTNTFVGDVYYTYRWPHEPVDFSGKRVAMIGAGSSAIQSVPLIAQQADQLTVFMRTANFSVPLNNQPTDPAAEAEYKKDYAAHRAAERRTFGGFVNVDGVPQLPRSDSALAASTEEREAEFEYRWRAGGLTFYTSYADLLTDDDANALVSDFMRRKIRAKIHDPRKADILTPRRFPAMTKRLCADTGYYETYNLDHVDVVDIRETPIERITPAGVEVAGDVREFDAIVFATGFDAVTGALDNIVIEGRGGERLRDLWRDGPTTYLGLMTHGFPNLFNVAGPGSGASLTHAIPCDEHQVDTVMQCISRVLSEGAGSIEPTREAEDQWTERVERVAYQTLFPKADSWYMGANVPGKARKPLLYLGGFRDYIERVDEVIDNDFAGFAVS
ncbi:flavin-containing monooxygenase [Microbacterium aurum]